MGVAQNLRDSQLGQSGESLAEGPVKRERLSFLSRTTEYNTEIRGHDL